MLRLFTTIIIAILLLSGCASVRDPSIQREKFSHRTFTDHAPVTKVLVVFDVSIDGKHRGIFDSKQEAIEKIYDPIANIVINELAEQGVQADYLLHTSPEPFIPPNSGYSHILVENLYNVDTLWLTNYDPQTSSSYSYPYVSGRQWSATLYETNNMSPANIIYEQVYSSNAPSCFWLPFLANSEQCKNTYIEHLLGHLSIIGIKSESIPRGIRLYHEGKLE